MGDRKHHKDIKSSVNKMSYNWEFVREIRENHYINWMDGVLKNFKNLGLGLAVCFRCCL